MVAPRRGQLPLNTARAMIMHIDLNSCFATVEQQAHVTLRGRPVAIVNRLGSHAAIITASYEAKARGVGTGMRTHEARRLCPGLVVLESDPPKYRYVYHQLMRIMSEYSAHVRMKSIDEGVIDMTEAPPEIRARDMLAIGYEIKQRLYSEVGQAMRCNVGVGPNRFLAKTAASLHKPDGLTLIDHTTLAQQLGQLRLTDLTGIAERTAAKLRAVGITTPTEFLAADEATLRQLVFKSIDGSKWYQRLRGYEVDKRDSPLRTAGRQYVLESRQLTSEQILQRLHQLCEEVGAKIRQAGVWARGVQVHARGGHRRQGSGSIAQASHSRYWQARHMEPAPFSSNQAIYTLARQLWAGAPDDVREIGVTCYQLTPAGSRQLLLFGDDIASNAQLTASIDAINQRFGDRTIHSAHTLSQQSRITRKIPFGSTRYL